MKGYDYSQAGLYFITVCVQNRTCLFAKRHNGKMILNDAGRMIEREWLALPHVLKISVYTDTLLCPIISTRY